MTITTHKILRVQNGDQTPTGKEVWEYCPPIASQPGETITIKTIDEETVEVTRKSKFEEKGAST